MHVSHKNVKSIIRNATREEYNHLVYKAFLTVREETILYLKKLNTSNLDIAERLAVSVDTVNHELVAIYDKLAKVISEKEN